MALRKADVLIEVTGVDYAPAGSRMIVRFTENIGGRLVDGEERIGLPVMISAKRLEAEQWIERQSDALEKATKAEVERINADRAKNKDDDGKPSPLPPLTGPAIEHQRAMVRERMISEKMRELGGAAWKNIVLQADRDSIVKVGYAALRALPRFAGAVDA